MAREQIAKKLSLDSDGATSSHAGPNVVALKFEFADGTEITIGKENVGATCQIAAFWHGLAQKIGDTYAGKTLAEAIEVVETVLERLAADDWIKAREGAGVRPSLVVDAIIAALKAAGQVVGDDRRAAIHDKTKTKEARDDALANPAIKAQYERIRAERATAKADAAARVAEGSDSTLEAF